MTDITNMTDQTNKTCENCGQGTYIETSMFDDMNGVLHCSVCDQKVKRWKK